MLAGVAAAVLVAASPANAATVAGLTAFGSGVTGFQTMAAAEGISREAVARVHATQLDHARKAESAFQAEYLKLVITAPETDWESAARAAESALMRLSSAAMLVSLPEAAPAPIASQPTTK